MNQKLTEIARQSGVTFLYETEGHACVMNVEDLEFYTQNVIQSVCEHLDTLSFSTTSPDIFSKSVKEEFQTNVPNPWVDFEKQKPLDVGILDVVVELRDGSILFCMSQSDGDFFWKPYNVFVNECDVIRWRPQTDFEING